MKPSEAKQLKPGDKVMDRGPFGGVFEVLRVEVTGPRSVKVFMVDGSTASADQLSVPTEAEIAAHENRKARMDADAAVREEMRQVAKAFGGASTYPRGSARWLGPESDYEVTLDRKKAMAVVAELEALRAEVAKLRAAEAEFGLPECEVVE